MYIPLKTSAYENRPIGLSITFERITSHQIQLQPKLEQFLDWILVAPSTSGNLLFSAPVLQKYLELLSTYTTIAICSTD